MFIDPTGEAKEYSLVVDNDGLQSGEDVVSGIVTLDAGWFPIMIEYFENEGPDGEFIKVKYSGNTLNPYLCMHVPTQFHSHTRARMHTHNTLTRTQVCVHA